jgi:hypothetical protein
VITPADNGFNVEDYFSIENNLNIEIIVELICVSVKGDLNVVNSLNRNGNKRAVHEPPFNARCLNQ